MVGVARIDDLVEDEPWDGHDRRWPAEPDGLGLPVLRRARREVVVRDDHVDVYLPDRARALERVRDALRPGGRVSVIVYSTPDRNHFFSIPVAIIRSRGLPPPAPGQPGPFSLGEPRSDRGGATPTGFGDVEVQTVEAPLRMTSAAECVRFERESFGALHQMLAALDEAERGAVGRRSRWRCASFDGADGLIGPCELIVAGARKA